MAAQTGTTQVTIRHPNDALEVDYTRRNLTLRNVINFLGGYQNGARGIGMVVDVQQTTNATERAVGDFGGDAVAATGTVTIASGSGTITATINGVAITATWATSDTATAATLAANINNSANALVAGLVSATSAAGVVTVTATVKGKAGNCVTLAASGTGASASGARLTGGVDATAKQLTF